MRNKKHRLHSDVVYKGYYQRKKRYYTVLAFLILLLFALFAITMTCGNTFYSPKTVMRVLLGENIKGATFTIMKLRLPRLIAAVLCGLAFGLAGNTFQKILGNPLASPDVIGVSASASVSAVFCILVLGLGGTIVPMISVVFSIAMCVLIYLLAQIGGYSNGKLILVGIGIQAMLHAVLSFILIRTHEHSVAKTFRWLSGSLNGMSMDRLPQLALVVACSLVLLLMMSRQLLMIQLKEEQALSLGLPVGKTRFLMIVVSLLATAFAVSVGGPIASVAFLSGPIASKISGKGGNNILASAIVGALLVVIADFAGQFVFAYKYPVGLVTGLIGAPYLLILLFRMNQKGARN